MRSASASEIGSILSSLNVDEPRVVISGNFATPLTLLEVLDGAVERYRLFALNPQPPWPCRPGVITETPFVGPGARSDPTLDYLPMRLSLVPRLFESVRPPDVVMVHCTTPRHDKVSLGIEVNILPAAIESARRRGGLVVAQMNPRMPFTLGDAQIDVRDIDLAFEVEEELPCHSTQKTTSPTPSPSPTSDECSTSAANTEIAAHASRFAVDGCTLQFGIGQVPDAVAANLHGHRGLGIWSEMISDGVMHLDRAGALDQTRPIRTSFLFGSPELYQWANWNPAIQMTRTETINNPALIAQNPAMLSLNTALQIDLLAQANASYVRGAVYSGFGGQPDFVVGSLHSSGGHSLIALRSWHDGTDSSTVLPTLATPVTSLQHSAVVTEHGCAEIFGRSQHAQARLIIDQCADPRARDQLWSQAAALGLGRRVG